MGIANIIKRRSGGKLKYERTTNAGYPKSPFKGQK